MTRETALTTIERLAYAADLLPTGLLVLGVDKKIRLANRALAASFGYRCEELLGREFSSLLARDFRALHEQLLDGYLVDPAHYPALADHRIVRGLRKDGSEIAVDIRLALHDVEGEQLVFVSLTDVYGEIAEHSLARQLEEQSRFLNEVLARTLSGLYIYDLNRRLTRFINPAYTAITGYNLHTLHRYEVDGDIQQLFHPDDREKIRELTDNVLAGNGRGNVGIEYRFRHNDGHWLWCYARESVYSYDETGKPKELLGSFFDISSLKEREQEISKLARDFSTTFEQAAVGIAHVDLHGRLLKVNRKLCEILGYSHDQLLLLTFAELTHSDDLGSSVDDEQRMLRGEIDQFIAEKRYRRCDGSIIWCHITVAIVRNGENENAHFISVVEDISARKNIELALAESNAALERFAYSASHDLQEPLRKISAFAGALETRLEGKLDDPDARFQLHRIADAARRMGNMIHSLLQLSRYSRRGLKKDRVRLSELLRMALDDLSNLLESQAAQVELRGDCTLLVEVNGFQQVLRNLISNSVNYARSAVPAHIVIEAQAGEGGVEIVLTDNGRGFDNSAAEQIFEPFRRLVGRDIPGTGMGLAICRQIVVSHNGKISAVSVPGNGARFTIFIPEETG